MRNFGHPSHIPQSYQQQYNQPIQQPFHPSQYMQYHQNIYQQPKSPFEQFAKPTQPQDWYTNYQPQGDNQQAQPQNGMISQFQDQNGQLNLDKVLSTVSQMANTYHQVSPIIKQFGTFLKTFR